MRPANPSEDFILQVLGPHFIGKRETLSEEALKELGHLKQQLCRYLEKGLRRSNIDPNKYNNRSNTFAYFHPCSIALRLINQNQNFPIIEREILACWQLIEQMVEGEYRNDAIKALITEMHEIQRAHNIALFYDPFRGTRRDRIDWVRSTESGPWVTQEELDSIVESFSLITDNMGAIIQIDPRITHNTLQTVVDWLFDLQNGHHVFNDNDWQQLQTFWQIREAYHRFVHPNSLVASDAYMVGREGALKDVSSCSADSRKRILGLLGPFFGVHLSILTSDQVTDIMKPVIVEILSNMSEAERDSLDAEALLQILKRRANIDPEVKTVLSSKHNRALMHENFFSGEPGYEPYRYLDLDPKSAVRLKMQQLSEADIKESDERIRAGLAYFKNILDRECVISLEPIRDRLPDAVLIAGHTLESYRNTPAPYLLDNILTWKEKQLGGLRPGDGNFGSVLQNITQSYAFYQQLHAAREIRELDSAERRFRFELTTALHQDLSRLSPSFIQQDAFLSEVAGAVDYQIKNTWQCPLTREPLPVDAHIWPLISFLSPFLAATWELALLQHEDIDAAYRDEMYREFIDFMQEYFHVDLRDRAVREDMRDRIFPTLCILVRFQDLAGREHLLPEEQALLIGLDDWQIERLLDNFLPTPQALRLVLANSLQEANARAEQAHKKAERERAREAALEKQRQALQEIERKRYEEELRLKEAQEVAHQRRQRQNGEGGQFSFRYQEQRWENGVLVRDIDFKEEAPEELLVRPGNRMLNGFRQPQGGAPRQPVAAREAPAMLNRQEFENIRQTLRFSRNPELRAFWAHLGSLHVPHPRDPAHIISLENTEMRRKYVDMCPNEVYGFYRAWNISRQAVGQNVRPAVEREDRGVRRHPQRQG